MTETRVEHLMITMNWFGQRWRNNEEHLRRDDAAEHGESTDAERIRGL
jgi:hypothetical protein